MSTTADVRVLYYRLFFVAGIPSGRDIETAVQKVVFMYKVLERVNRLLGRPVVQESYFYVLRIFKAAEPKCRLYGVFQKRAFAVLVAVE